MKILNTIIQDLPKECFVNEERRTSIIHESSGESIPEDLMLQILEMYPEIIVLQDNIHGNSIAHMVCSQRHGTASVLQAILDKNQSLASLQDNDGNLPLHVVNSDRHSEEMIQILLTSYPQGIMITNNQMETPFSSRLT